MVSCWAVAKWFCDKNYGLKMERGQGRAICRVRVFLLGGEGVTSFSQPRAQAQRVILSEAKDPRAYVWA